MRTIKTVSRVIEAIKTENLGHKGGWVLNRGLPYKGDCTVCAVGGVLRHLGLPNKSIGYIAYQETTHPYANLSTIPTILKDGDYFGALSSYFECRENRRLSQKVIRRKLIAFVKKNFPKRITLKNPIAVPNSKELEQARVAYLERQLAV